MKLETCGMVPRFSGFFCRNIFIRATATLQIQFKVTVKQAEVTKFMKNCVVEEMNISRRKPP